LTVWSLMAYIPKRVNMGKNPRGLSFMPGRISVSFYRISFGKWSEGSYRR
jgi:hypothetical protein